MSVMPEILSYADLGFLPIVAAFVKKIGVADEVDRLCAMESDGEYLETYTWFFSKMDAYEIFRVSLCSGLDQHPGGQFLFF